MASSALKIDSTRATVSTPHAFPEGTVTQEEISHRAYNLWMERGCPTGSGQEDWFRAENELETRQEAEAALVRNLERLSFLW
jgi:Protein of unknown function (DUF2934)